MYTKMYTLQNTKGRLLILNRPSEENIYQAIKEAILNRKLRPNTQLIEDALAESFGVSRTPVRQALRKLSYEKLVKIIPNKGAYVNCPTVEETKQIDEARIVLEAALVRKACRTITKEQIEQIASLINEEKAADLAGDKFEALRLSLNFHLKIAEISGNSFIYRYLQELTSLVYLIVTFYGSDKTFSGWDDHFKLLDIIAEGNEDLAESFMIDHLREVESGFDYEQSFTTSLIDIFK